MTNFDTEERHDPFIVAATFRSSYWLVKHFSPRLQGQLLGLSGMFSLLFVVGWLMFVYTPLASTAPAWIEDGLIVGGMLLLMLFLLVSALHSFYLYYRLTVPEQASDDADRWEHMSFPAAITLLAMRDANDLLEGFLQSQYGREIILRCGIHPDHLLRLVQEQSLTNQLQADMAVEIDTDAFVTLSAIVDALYRVDKRFSEALMSSGITEDVLLSAARWIQRTDRHRCEKIRFWAPERLQEIPSLTQDFAYGRAYTLEKFSRRMMSEAVFLGTSSTDSAFEDDIAAVFNILSRPRDANVLLVGHSAGGVGDIIMAVKSRLQTNDVPPSLEDKRLYVLDTQALVAAAEESKGQFEYLLTKLLTEATLAGNVVLVIEHFIQFRLAANQLSVNLLGILDRYLNHPDLPIIATSSAADYHQHLEGREVMSSFGSVLVHDVDDDTLLKLLGEIAVASEGNTICTVGALEATARGARTLITDDEMPHAAIDLFLEILSTRVDGFVDKQVVNAYLSQKTGVPTGEISDEERASLTGLEDELKKRVIGQDTAVQAVAAALRRNRAGVEDQDRPIGTFLFLGPTGVGKTETAKTLNRVYFNDAGLRRLDMSEYSQISSIDDLRGTSGQSGRLADMVREKPYGVLLLDEFEKAHRQVHDLFLQILDEGYFTDGRGRRVSLDNMIIIATSNAGAQEIFSYVEAGDDLSERQEDIIDSLVADGEFRPELINRFDAAVIYHPLTTDNLIQITEILLHELHERMKVKGFRLEIGGKVAAELVERGYNPEFGARAIRRVIQDTVENIIADKIIDEGLHAGDKITLMTADLTRGQ
ncbi:MAG: trigger factor [Candidatus Paceibacterota bacterium]